MHNATCSGTATGFGGGKIVLQIQQTVKTDTATESMVHLVENDTSSTILSNCKRINTCLMHQVKY